MKVKITMNTETRKTKLNTGQVLDEHKRDADSDYSSNSNQQ